MGKKHYHSNFFLKNFKFFILQAHIKLIKSDSKLKFKNLFQITVLLKFLSIKESLIMRKVPTKFQHTLLLNIVNNNKCFLVSGPKHQFLPSKIY